MMDLPQLIQANLSWVFGLLFCYIYTIELKEAEKMQAAKEKLSNMTSAAKEHAKIYKAKVEEKVEKATARTKEEKEIAHERRKAKENQAKMELHAAKAERLNKQRAHHAPLVGTHGAPLGGAAHGPLLGTHGAPVAPATTGVTAPTYAVGGPPPPAAKYL